MDEVTRAIALLTDFGLRDHYVGQVKSVLATLAPSSPIIDISHGVEPFAIAEGAWMLETALSVVPSDAVVMAVVDPGVGSARKGICVESGGRTFVGPDNGLLSPAFAAKDRPEGPGRLPFSGVRVYELANPKYKRADVSHTFHGRDIFAPAAAARAVDVPAQDLGPELERIELLPPIEGHRLSDGSVTGEVIHIDHYGNLVTTIRAEQIMSSYTVEIGELSVEGGGQTFSDAPAEGLLSHIDSSGFLAIAANLASAAEFTGARRGDPVTVRLA